MALQTIDHKRLQYVMKIENIPHQYFLEVLGVLDIIILREVMLLCKIRLGAWHFMVNPKLPES